MLNIPTWLLCEDELATVIARWRDVINNSDELASEEELDALAKLEAYALDFRGVEVPCNPIVIGAKLK